MDMQEKESLIFLLVQLLHEQAVVVDFNVRLVSENKIRRCHCQRNKYRQMQGQLFALWEQYIAGDKSAKQLLRKMFSSCGYCTVN